MMRLLTPSSHFGGCCTQTPPQLSIKTNNNNNNRSSRKNERGLLGGRRRNTDFLTLCFFRNKRSSIIIPHLPLLPQSTLLTWPQPHYSQLSGVDLLIADIKSLVAYGAYFYYTSKLWTKPLPEDGYDPEVVAFYFSLRPHLVALRFLEVFSSFAAAAIRIRMLRFNKDVGKNIDKDVMQHGVGMIVKETMLKLGPTFIKVGQSLSTRPDLIGSEISLALSDLHDRIPPFPNTMAMKIIEEELGCPVEINFSQISEEAVAAASFGQVYHGRTIDGLNVAVKIQRPNLRDLVLRDIYLLRIGLGLVRKIAKRKSDIRVYADELGKGLVGELDYSLEATNALEFKEAHAPFSFIRVPKVYKHLSSKRVLTMEWIVGESSSELLNLSSPGSTSNDSSYLNQLQTEARKRLLKLANLGVEATLVQLLDTGLLHADPHPGNLRYTSSGEIGFLDFGLLCRMQKKHQYAILASMLHIVNGDWASLVNALTDMDVSRPGTNLRRVTADMEDALGGFEFKDGFPDVKFSKVLGQIWSVAIKYHLRMPPYYTLVLRSLASLEGLAVAADPNFKTFEAAFPFVVQKLLTDNSPASKKILYSVVLNQKKEFQWQKIALFVRVGTSRKGLVRILAPKNETCSVKQYENGLFNLSEWVLRFLCSKDGAVMRKLLMTANGASLIRAVVSKESNAVRQSLCTVIADVIYQWMLSLAFQLGVILTGSRNKRDMRSIFSPFNSDDYWKFLKDRRLKVICLKVFDSAKRDDSVLVLRFCFTSALILATASALAIHQILIDLSEAYLGPTDAVSFATRREKVRVT